MNCNVPTDICFSLRGFSTRGGGTHVHADGFGIAFSEGRGCRIFLDPQPGRLADAVLLDVPAGGVPIRGGPFRQSVRFTRAGRAG